MTTISLPTVQNISQTIKVRQLYDNFITAAADEAWDKVSPFSTYAEIIDGLIRSDKEIIRRAFSDGYLAMLCPEFMIQLELRRDGTPSCTIATDHWPPPSEKIPVDSYNIELRIVDDNDKLVCVLVNDDISW